MKSKSIDRIFLGVILILAAGLFASLMGAKGLTWDDDSNIFANPYYRSGLWLDFWRAPYFGIYVPVTSAVWEILYVLGQGAAWPYRLLNLALHLLNIVLAYKLLSSLSTRWNLGSRWPVLVGTALFAFHPLQVETVAWISGGRDLLSATFALSAVYFYFRAAHVSNAVFATFFFALSILAKPATVVLPAVVFWLEFWLRPEGLRRTLGWMALWLAIAFWPTLITMQAQAEHIPQVDWWLRPWIMADGFAFYIQKLLWPWPLSGNYARTPEYVTAHPHTLWNALGFVALTAIFSAWSWRYDRRYSIGAVWLLLLLPVSGIFAFGFQKISTTADHYHYLPMLPVAAVVMLVLDRLKIWERSSAIVSAGVLGFFFTLSCLRVGDWASDKAFFEQMAQFAPESYSTAIGMSIVTCQDERDYDAGVRWTEVALKARPDDILALANQAYCFVHAKNFFRVTELEFYLNRMNLEEMESKQPTAYSSLLASIGTAEVELKEYEIGYQYLCEAYRIKPSEPTHARNLEIATGILKEQGFQPSCEKGLMDHDEPEDELPDEN